MNLFLFEGLITTVIILATFGVYAIIAFTFSEKFIQNRFISKLFAAASPFIFILLGFILKIGNALDYFVLVVIILLAVSIYFIIESKIRILTRINPTYIFYSILAGYLLFYDAIKYESVGFIDSSSSHRKIITILSGADVAYQPGYAILLAPLYWLREPTEELNFVGASTAFVIYILISILLSTLSIYIWYILVILSFLPIFTEVLKTLIGVTSNSISILALSFIIIINFLYKNSYSKYFFALFMIVYIASGVTTPVLLFYLITPLVAMLIISLINNRDKSKIYFYQLVGSFIGFGLYAVNFIVPSLYVNVNATSEPLRHIEGTIDLVIEDQQSFLIYLFENTLILDSANIRDIKSITNLGGYAIVLVALFMIILLLKKREYHKYLFPNIIIFIFGISTLTGLLDVPYIKGRVGWYFTWSVLLAASYLSYLVIMYFYRCKKKSTLYTIISLNIFVLLMVEPPQHYRYVDEDAYKALKKVIQQYDQELPIYLKGTFSLTTDRQSTRLDDTEFNNNLKENKMGLYVIALDFKNETLDPVLSRQFDFRDINTTGVDVALEETLNMKLDRSNRMENIVNGYDFDIIYDDGNYKIYSKSIP